MTREEFREESCVYCRCLSCRRGIWIERGCIPLCSGCLDVYEREANETDVEVSE